MTRRSTPCPQCGRKYKGKRGLATHMHKAGHRIGYDKLPAHPKGASAAPAVPQAPQALLTFHEACISQVIFRHDSVTILYTTKEVK